MAESNKESEASEEKQEMHDILRSLFETQKDKRLKGNNNEDSKDIDKHAKN